MGLAAEASGSNNWAVSGARSATGSPLIAGDPHLPPSMPGIWYEIELRHGERFVRGASLPGMPGVYMGQNNDVCWTITNVMGDVQDLFVERIEDEQLPLRGRLAAAAHGPRGDPGQGARRAGSCSRSASTHHGPIVNEALGADEAEPLALRWQTLDEPTAFAGHVRAAGHRLRPGAGGGARGPHLARLEHGLGRPPRLDRLQADRPPAAPPRRLPGPAEAGLDRRVRVGGDDPLRGAAGGDRPRERLPRHRQQPHRRRRLPAPHHQRVARRLPRQADRADAGRARSARPRRLRGDADRRPLAARAWRRRAGSRACTRAASASARRSSGCAAGTVASTPTPSPARSTRPSCCAWRARWRGRRSATATSASAGSTAPTTASPRTSPRPGAGTRT